MSDLLIKNVNFDYARKHGGLILHLFVGKEDAMEVAMEDTLTGDCLGFCRVQELPEHGDLVEREEVLSCILKHIKYQAKQEEYMAQTALTIAYGEIITDGKGIFKDSLVPIPTILEASKED